MTEDINQKIFEKIREGLIKSLEEANAERSFPMMLDAFKAEHNRWMGVRVNGAEESAPYEVIRNGTDGGADPQVKAGFSLHHEAVARSKDMTLEASLREALAAAGSPLYTGSGIRNLIAFMEGALLGKEEALRERDAEIVRLKSENEFLSEKLENELLNKTHKDRGDASASERS